MACVPVAWLRILALLPPLLFAASVSAAPRTPHFVKLEYVLGEGAEEACPSEAMMRHALLARLDEDPFSDSAKAKLRVTIVRVGEAFQASYELCDEVGKCMQGAPVPNQGFCINAVESVAFSVGIFMPGLLTASTPGRRDPPPPPPPPPPPAPPPPPPPPPPVKLPVSLRLDGGALMSFESAPKLAAGFWLHVGVRLRDFSLSGGFRQDFPATRHTGDISLTTSRSLGELVPCVHWKMWDPTNIAVCGLLQIGGVWALGETPYSLKTDEQWTVLVGGRLGFEIPVSTIFPSAKRVPVVSRLAFLVPVDLTAMVVRPRIEMDGAIKWTPHSVPMTVGFGFVASL